MLNDWKCVETLNDKWLITKVFKDIKNGFFIEAGSSDGLIESSSCILEKEYDWTGILVEPNEEFFTSLTNNRKSICINKALYNVNGKSKFIECKNKYYSCIIETMSPWHRSECYEDGYLEKEVECVTLNTLLKKYNAPKHINFISLDTEGSELKILYEFPFEEYKVDLFIIEMSDENRIKSLLFDKGYREVFNEYNTKCPWECYFFHKEFNNL